MIARDRARALPEIIRKLPPATKIVYLYLRTQGLVKYSQRDLAGAVGLDAYTVQQAFKRLDSIGAIRWHTEPQERTRREYEAVSPDDLEVQEREKHAQSAL